MGRDALALIAVAAIASGCPSPAAPVMRDQRVVEVAVACAKERFGGNGVGGCPLRLDEAEVDDLVRPDGEKVFRVAFEEARCKASFERGLVLEIDAGGTCTKVGP